MSELLWFMITSLSDLFKVLTPLFQQIRSGSRVHIFPRFVSAMCNYFEFWLVYRIVLRPFWLAKVITLVLVLRHSIETRSMERLIRPLRGILLGIPVVTKSTKLLLHHLILVARYHIYICKLKETRPSLEMYKQLVYNTSEIESKVAIANNSMHVFKKKWSCFKNVAPFQSINQSINQSISQSNSLSVSQSINQSINQSVSQSINQSINQSKNMDWVMRGVGEPLYLCLRLSCFFKNISVIEVAVEIQLKRPFLLPLVFLESNVV